MSDSAIYDPHAAEPLPDLPTPATRIQYTTCRQRLLGSPGHLGSLSRPYPRPRSRHGDVVAPCLPPHRHVLGNPAVRMPAAAFTM